MNYIKKTTNNQDENEKNLNYLKIPAHSLGNFENTDTTIEKDSSGNDVFCFNGYIDLNEKDLICDKCGKKMHINNTYKTKNVSTKK